MNTAWLTHQGYRRENNEDNCFIKVYSETACLVAVADGMGGEIGGDRASGIAVECVAAAAEPKGDIHEALRELIRTAHASVREAVTERPEFQGMGSTLVMAYVRRNRLYWASVGDSRLYLFRDANLMRLTHDHTVPGRLLEKGEITEHEARRHPMRNQLLMCVGCRQCQPDSGGLLLKNHDILLLCSDGLYGQVPSGEIARILGEFGPLGGKLQALVDAALKAGGADNVTVACVAL